MAFDTLNDFFAMGGHAVYVWTSWGLTLALLVGLVVHAFQERRQLMRQLQRQARREERRQPQSRTSAPSISNSSEASTHDA
ncbi:MAG TPA: heme exporter protein CcmD [Candidatus Halomonas stercoripullorum]|uniref:Heme exporter protein D n=1 Tax=Candidatus Halomonas stercoripullorum TaxID=2838617 RepID=A0A9D1WL92_9GAMM|nr:heme exporter protein CcmD [Candidatus Halomonas stercoripullorum]